MADARGCVKNLSHHGRYGQAGTTTCLVLHYLYNAENLSKCSCPCPGFVSAFVRWLKYSYMVSLQRKSLMRDPTLAEVGTHNASVSEDKSVSCPPNFSARRLVRCSCYMFEGWRSTRRDGCGSSLVLDTFHHTCDNYISILA